jgi:hypothetical protein
MEVLVSSSGGTLRLAFVGEVDEAAPAIARAAMAAARGDHVALQVDTTRAHPSTSPILARVRRSLRAASAHQRVDLR